MVRLDLDLDTRENYDDFLSKGGMKGMMGGIFKKLGSCMKKVSDASGGKFASKKIKGLNKKDKAEHQKLMKACMGKGKKKRKIVHRQVGATEYQKMRENGMSEKQINKFKKAEKVRDKLRNKKYEEKLLKSKAEIPKTSEEMLANPQGRLANPDLNLGDTPTPKKANMGKLLVYGVMGIVVLFVGYKIIKG